MNKLVCRKCGRDCDPFFTRTVLTMHGVCKYVLCIDHEKEYWMHVKERLDKQEKLPTEFDKVHKENFWNLLA